MGLLVSGNNPAALKTAERTYFTATAGQTTFTIPTGYAVGDIDVYMNGVRLVDADDYFALNGSTVILSSAASLGDSIVVVSYLQFQVAAHYTKTESDSRYISAAATTPLTSFLRTPNYGVSSTGDNLSTELTAAAIGQQGVGVKAYGRSMATFGGDLHLIADNRGAGGSHRFYSWNGTSLTTYMNIDSGGRVTMPNQPRASLSDSRNIQLNDVVLTSANFYNTTWVNVGNHFNASTGRFTCPVAGVYRIYFRGSGLTNQGNNVRLRKNGTTINEAYSSGITSGLYSFSSEAVFPCVAGDYLDIQVSTLYVNDGSQHKQATFELLG